MMNKLIILAFALFLCGLLAAPAAAVNAIDNADFFYGIVIDNGNDGETGPVAVQKTDEIPLARLLSPSEFFYGSTAAASDDALVRHLNLRNCNYTWGRITPAKFFGYTDENIIVQKCACTNC